MKLGLVIPLFNEAELVTEVVASIHATLEQADISYTLVLVNNGSEDQTGSLIDDLAQAPSIQSLHLRENAGYGGGILSGMALLEQQGLPDIVGWCWGDGQISPKAIPALFHACVQGAPMAKTIRTERQDGPVRQVVTTSYSLIMRSLGCTNADVNGCPKLMTKEAFLTLQPRSMDWFLDAEVVLGAQARGWEITTHPVTMRPRTAGHSKVRWTTLGEFAWNLTRWRLQNRL
ncbi:MAG: glycosyltransferase family 2 protein [Myxococcota bacterium]